MTGENSRNLQYIDKKMKNDNKKNLLIWLEILAAIGILIFILISPLLLFNYSMIFVISLWTILMVIVFIIAIKFAIVWVPQDVAFSANVLWGAVIDEEDGYKRPAIYFSGLNIWNPFHVKDDEIDLTTIDFRDTTQLECLDNVPVEGEFEGKVSPALDNGIFNYLRLASDDYTRRSEAERIAISSIKGIMNSKAKKYQYDDLLGDQRNDYTKEVFDSYDNKGTGGGRVVEKSNGLEFKSVVVSNLNTDPQTLESMKQKNIVNQDLKAAEVYLKKARKNKEKMTLAQAIEHIQVSRGITTKKVNENRNVFDFPPGTEKIILANGGGNNE